MNGKLAKKIRKAVNKKINYDYDSLAKTLFKESWWWRLKYAWRIIWKKDLQIKIKKTYKGK